MRHAWFFIAGFVFSFLMTSVATAISTATPADEFAKVISYRELMSLSPQAREVYIRGLRNALVELERMQRSNSVNGEAKARTSARIFLLKALIQTAEAQWMDGKPNSAHAGYLVSPVRQPNWSIQPTDQRALQNVFALNHTAAKCPQQVKSRSDFQKLLRDGGGMTCAIAIGGKDRFCPGGFTFWGKTPYGVNICWKPAPVKVVKKIDAIGERITRAERRKALPRRKPATEPKDQAAADGDDEAIATSLNPDDDQHAPRAETGPLELVPGVGATNLDAAKGAEGEACGAPVFDQKTCNDETIRKAKGDFYRSKSPHCLYAGNLSHFRGNEKRAGNCQAPTGFCVNSVTCRGPKNEVLGRPNFECKGPNEVICNPYLFNLDRDDKALCVKASRNATAQCTAKANEIDAEKLAKAQDDAKRDHPDNVPDWVQTSFLARVKNINGIIESWEEFRTEINKMCFESPSKDVFCNECFMLKTRLYNMHLVAMTKGKTPTPEQCHMIMSLKNQGPPASAPTGRPARAADAPTAR